MARSHANGARADGSDTIATNNSEILVESRNPAKRGSYLLLLLLILLSIPVFLIGLGHLPLLGPDEPRYAEVAREMFVTHDYISPRLCGCLWFEKPALYYWMAAGSYAALGVNEFAARAPSAVSAIGSVAVLFYGLRRRISSRFAFLVCLVLMTSPLFMGFARAAVTDMPLTAAVTVSLTALYLAVTGTGRERMAFWLVGCAATGVAVLAKGLVGVVLFLLIGVISLALARDWSLLRWRELLLGGLVFAAVCSIWYGPVYARHGWPFVQDFFINHHFKRYLTNEFHHPEPLYFYPFIILAGLVPWTFYLIPSVFSIRSAIKTSSASVRYLVILGWIWLLVPLVFFSLSESKLPSYILPAFPGAAILIGLQLDRVWASSSGRGLTLANWLTAIMTIGLGAALPIYIRIQSIQSNEAGKLLQWTPLVIGLIGTISLALKRTRHSIASTALLVPIALIAAMRLVLPGIEQRIGLKALSTAAANALRPGEEIAFYLDKQYSPVFYARGRVMCGGKASDVLDARTTGDLVEALSSVPSLIVITKGEWTPSLMRDSRLEVEPLGTEGDEIAFRVTMRSAATSS